ncbi:3267_t:CDS:2, partial [Acaulospora colombiana]
KLCEQPRDATAFSMRVPYLVAPSLVLWTSDDPEATTEARERHRALRTFGEGELKSTFGTEDHSAYGTGYGNGEPRDPRDQDAAKSLFGDNYPRLQALKAKSAIHKLVALDPVINTSRAKSRWRTPPDPRRHPPKYWQLHRHIKSKMNEESGRKQIKLGVDCYTYLPRKSSMIRALNFDWKTPLLEAGFTGDLVTPSDPDYQVSLKRFVKNAQRNAALVAF